MKDNESLYYLGYLPTPSRRQSKTLILSKNVDQKSLETELWIATNSKSNIPTSTFLKLGA